MYLEHEAEENNCEYKTLTYYKTIKEIMDIDIYYEVIKSLENKLIMYSCEFTEEYYFELIIDK